MAFRHGTEIPFHYGNRHVIIAAQLSEALIERILHYIDSQGALLECTLSLANGDDETETSED